MTPLPTWDLLSDVYKRQMLPSVRTLAKELKISALTVKKAYDFLEEEGFVVTVHGKGLSLIHIWYLILSGFQLRQSVLSWVLTVFWIWREQRLTLQGMLFVRPLWLARMGLWIKKCLIKLNKNIGVCM